MYRQSQVSGTSRVPRERRAASLVEALTATLALGLLLSLGVPAGVRLRELGNRSVCAANLAGIGSASKIYAAADRHLSWPVVPHAKWYPGAYGVDYVNRQSPSKFLDPGAVGWRREEGTTTDLPIAPGSTAASTARSFWLLVRGGHAAPTQFVCPSSGDVANDSVDSASYHDFAGYDNVSYGFQVPYGPTITRANSKGADHRRIVAADKGPFYSSNSSCPEFVDGTGKALRLDADEELWRPHNSPNHESEGQNALFQDGHVEFAQRPTIGIDYDNIFTVIEDEWWETYERDGPSLGVIHGDAPHCSEFPHPHPGQGAFGGLPANFASTDSLIYP